MAEKGGIFSIFKRTDEDDEMEYQDENEVNDDIIELPKYQPSNKGINLGQSSGGGQVKLVIVEPTSYSEEDCCSIVDSLKERKICIVKLSEIKDVVEAHLISAYLGGAIYAMEGAMKQISNAVILLAPNNTDIDGNLRKELENKGFFKWK